MSTPPPDPTSPRPPAPKPRGPVAAFLAIIERLGNLLPNPVTLFALLALLVVVGSGIAAATGLSVEDPRPNAAEGARLEARSLLSPDGFRWMSQSLVTNFTGFAPLGTVLVALLGVGIAEKAGLLSAAVRAMVLAAPKQLVTVVIVFAGVLSNAASEMGYVILIPLAMTIFHALGRHPMVGMAAAFAGVSGGYSANLVLGTIDPLLSGLTQESARLLDPEYTVNPACNWYFMVVSTFLITGLGWFVTARIVEPRLGAYDDGQGEAGLKRPASLERLTTQERKALLAAGASVAVLTLLLVVMAGPGYLTKPDPDGLGWKWLKNVPCWGLLRNPDPAVTGPKALDPLLHSVVPIIFIFFAVPGVIFGWMTRTMRGEKQIIDSMAEAMRSMGLYIVLVFFAAQFVAFFNYSGLGTILAVLGADALVAMRLDGPVVFVPFIILCAIVNLLIGSASAKWAVTAPIFVPMLMRLGYSPEVIQCAYRIGDSTTNVITPMMSYFGLILAMGTRYQRNLGIGTLVSTMLPYTIVFLVGWMVLFYTWVFALGLPVGPDSPTTYGAAAAG